MFTLGGQGNHEMTSIQPLVIFFAARYNLPVTVEQRVYPQTNRDQQRPDQPLHTENEALNENGAKVRASLLEIFHQHLDADPELIEFLLADLETYPVDLFNQLGMILESPVFKAQDGQKGHWAYELTMVDRTLGSAANLREAFGWDNRKLADVVFMIVVGDIGKAGPVSMGQEAGAAIVSRIYNQAIFHGEHQAWLKSCDPATFPDELQPVLANIDRREPEGGGLSPWDLAFKSGTFIGLPIEIYLYVLKQVALEKLAGQPEQVASMFTLSQAERDFLTDYGFDPAQTPIRKFFTGSHVLFGQIFLNRLPLSAQKSTSLVPLALAHHLSQGVLPIGFDVEAIAQDDVKAQTCAYLEILDKVDAIYHRSSIAAGADASADYHQRAIDTATSITELEVKSNLERNFPHFPKLADIYAKTLQQMKEAGVFNFS